MTARNSKPMAGPSFVKSFKDAGHDLAELYRKHLPKAILGKPNEQITAQRLLTAAADEASERLRRASNKWVSSDYLTHSVEAGQKRAAADISIKFGGANTQLINRMAYEASRNLIIASDSTRPFLAQTIRRSQAIAISKGTTAGSVQNLGNAKLEQAFNTALTQGALESEHGRQIAKRIMKNTGLEQGDNVLLMNGQSWDAEVYARLEARTRKAEAENLGYADTLQQNGYEFIITSEHGGVTPGDICEFLQGKVWALTENTQGIPVLPAEYGLPPWHPNCGHTFSVWIPEFHDGQRSIDAWAKVHEKTDSELEQWQSKSGKFLSMMPKKK